MKIDDRAHFWNRPFGMKPQCHRVIIKSVSSDGLFARVEIQSEHIGPSVVSLETKRLKLGWNNWIDQEGRPL